MGVRKKYILPIKWKLEKWKKASEWVHPDGEDMQDLIKDTEEKYHKAMRSGTIKEQSYHQGRLELLKELFYATESQGKESIDKS